MMIDSRRKGMWSGRETLIYGERFGLERVLAKGGFSTVYLATDNELDETVAIKVAKLGDESSYNEMVYREAELLAACQHKGIVTLNPLPALAGKQEAQLWANAENLIGQPAFFVMEYLSGGTVQHYLEAVGQLPGHEAAAIGVMIARGLDHIHRKGLAHNDLKLENIVFRTPVEVGQPFEPVLVDFGIATKMTKQSQKGTLYIMSPEQVAMRQDNVPPELRQALQANLDRVKVDVWGLGVVLYTLISGQLPFKGKSRRGMTTRILKETPDPLTKSAQLPVSPFIEELILDGCLSKDPRTRLSLLELGLALKKYAQGVVATRSGINRSWWKLW